MATFDINKIIQLGGFPWELTPFTRPSTYRARYAVLAEILGYYSATQLEKQVLLGKPSYSDLKRLVKSIGEDSATGCILNNMNGLELKPWTEKAYLEFLQAYCKPFIEAIENTLAVRVVKGEMVVPEKYLKEESPAMSKSWNSGGWGII